MQQHEVYRRAATSIRQGWTRWHWEDTRGRVCLMGALQRSSGLSGDRPQPIDPDLIVGLHEQLLVQPFYRILWAHKPDKRACIQNWNDAPWRRKRSVVAVIEGIADKAENRWLADERSRLLIEMTALQCRVSQLETEVARLERENLHLWSRLGNRRIYRASVESLQCMVDELESKQADLDAVGPGVRGG